ncbi:MAG: DUF4159 domain-containing protein [Bacteroidales bacterium]|nr:DUF4159 domain-containing protein [Bacteroidales bacterium]
MKKQFVILLIFTIFISASHAQVQASVKIGLLKYRGGGDWYADPTALPNLIAFCNTNLGTNIYRIHDVVEVGSPDIFNYPFVHMTGHGNVIFSDAEAQNLRNYLIAGGFLHIDDNYGMDEFIRPQMQKIFPELEMVELPFDYPIYNQKYKFQNGIPKIHEHDGKPAQGFGYFWEGRLVIYYSYESDLSDGWEDADVHNDSPETRLKALQMGANIIEYVFNR